MNQQYDLFDGMDIRTEKEKENDSFGVFFKEFSEKFNLFDLFPHVTQGKNSGKFFKLLKNLYLSHVFHGGWSEELFSQCVFEVLEQGKTLSHITLGACGAKKDKEVNTSEQ